MAADGGPAEFGTKSGFVAFADGGLDRFGLGRELPLAGGGVAVHCEHSGRHSVRVVCGVRLVADLFLLRVAVRQQ
jgi:hypothetical protein